MKDALVIILFHAAALMISAQQVTSVENDYNGLTFKAFADSLQQKEIVIYYRDDMVEGIKIVQDTTPANIENLFKKSLGSQANYIRDPNGNYIITGTTRLDTAIVDGFFDTSEVFSRVIIEEGRNKNNGRQEEKEMVLQQGMNNQRVTIGNPANRISNKKVTVSGIVTEAETGEPIIGAVLYAEDLEIGTISDNNGYYVLTIPTGQHQLSVRCVGRQNESYTLMINESGSLNISLEEKITKLRGVVVVADKGKNVTGMQIGLNKVNVEMIKQIPAMMGEADVLKTAILLPGVQTVGEGASGFNVRGGSTDQNLILFNGAPVFNSSHFFGFFSAFNPDLVKEFELYKSGIPAKYGGRISSVFDITSKAGNNKNVAGAGGISPITAKLLVEGPTVKKRGSFLAGIRSTYSNWLLKQFPVPTLKNSNASFYDATLIITHRINSKNDLSISAYTSNDNFRLNNDTTYNYRNINGSVTWKHRFTDRFIGEFKGIYSHYNYDIRSTGNPVNAFSMKYRINYYEGRVDFRYYPNANHTIKFGLNNVVYRLDPGVYRPVGSGSLVEPLTLETEQANEIAVYISEEYNMGPNLSLYAGLRIPFYSYLAPQTVYQYGPGPRETGSIIDTTKYNKGIIESYLGPELRLSLRYKTSPVSSVKFSYNRMRQNLHMLSNTTAISPTDIWKLSDSHIKPQIGDQIAMGYYRDLRSNTVETSLEFYYKHIKDIIEYKGGAQLTLNENIESDLINGQGQAYGAEFLIKKKYGRFNGWISYTFSRTWIQVNGDYPDEIINEGEYYPANFDKPHDLTGILSYRFNRRLSISSNITYSTGRPITYPVGKYYFGNSEYLHYSNRNEYRVPDYFRCDISINLEGNLKSNKLAHSSWSLSIYNVTGRDNVYSIYFVNEGGKIQGYKLSIFTRPLPTLTYSFRF